MALKGNERETSEDGDRRVLERPHAWAQTTIQDSKDSSAHILEDISARRFLTMMLLMMMMMVVIMFIIL